LISFIYLFFDGCGIALAEELLEEEKCLHFLCCALKADDRRDKESRLRALLAGKQSAAAQVV